ncbi:hypothetical protein CVT26_012596 [Gymnopilus dilepis]|uniref:Uncharacterized protein n=1 Tax=Gymnopilus dilepis TaxID=231916 RepID=A0A409WMQ4_9AGAR|nr:hypothetical protein CVT26_012596 [Gymnopilus dilepis]
MNSKKLEYRARRWMISPEWLKVPGNSVYDVPGRIAESGKAWGDPEDPEDIEAKHQRVKEEKEVVKRRKVGKGKNPVSKGAAASSKKAVPKATDMSMDN